MEFHMRFLIYAAMLLAVVSTASAAETPVVSKQKPVGKDYGWLFRYLDRNKNSAIDPEDIQQMPSPMRNWLLKIGIDSRQTISQNQFLQFAPQMMETIRKQKYAPSNLQPAFVFVRESFDFSTRLPTSHRRSDKNGDGQIGFYEWGARDSATFSKLDKNDDGFLTPRELGVSPAKLTGKAKKRRNKKRSPRQLSRDAASDEFTKADRNKNRQLSEKEWSRLPFAQRFTKSSGPQPTFPMLFQQFNDFYRQKDINFNR